MYYAIGVSVPSLHRESTDSLIAIETGQYVRPILPPEDRVCQTCKCNVTEKK